ncbi:MAG: NAD(P)/FAD-dependent oxidoreductase [Dethiobacteraceae bacterium]|jgi:thioredoxin reductase (NADPH)|nr:NAD(P)/FAD-dependent oxidoreductase [Bacillota bacterium]
MQKVDVAIIGCGPAGLSAAINVQARNRTLLLVGPRICSQSLHKAHQVNNYLGFYNLSGEELLQQFLKHAQSAGIEVKHHSITAVYPLGDSFQLQLRDEVVEAKTVIIATGVAAGKRLPGEDNYLGRGVSYCATCDAMFFRDKTVAVSSDSAEHEDEVKLLTEIAAKVYFLPQYESTLQLPANVELLAGQKIRQLTGSAMLEELELTDGSKLKVDGVFLLKEQYPLTQIIPGLELEDKHIKVDLQMATNIPGVFACGDVVGRPYQVAKAVGQGQVAALSAVAYLDSKAKA